MTAFIQPDFNPNIVIQLPGCPRRVLDPQEDITPVECVRLTQLIMGCHAQACRVESIWEWIESHGLERHFPEQ